MPRQVSTKQRAFIAAVQAGMPGSQAAIQAGYSPKSAKHTAHYLMHESGVVKAELARVQSKLAEQADYNGEKALADLEKAIDFARLTKNAAAYVRAIELKARLFGLLTEKVEMNFKPIDITDALAEARGRVSRGIPHIIEAEAVDVTNTAADIFS